LQENIARSGSTSVFSIAAVRRLQNYLARNTKNDNKIMMIKTGRAQQSPRVSVALYNSVAGINNEQTKMS